MKLREALDTYMFDNVGQFGGIAESLGDEFRTIIAALQAAKLIILGDIEVDAKTCSECKSYFFTINKLLSTFEKQLLQE